MARTYDRNTKVYENAYALTIEKSMQYLTETDSVLDIACGTGIVTLEIARVVKEVTALDISPRMIEVIREKAGARGINNIGCFAGEISDPALSGRSFDAVLLMNILHFIPKPGPFLDSVRALLKPNGYLLLASDCMAEKTSVPAALRNSLLKLLSSTGLIPFMDFLTENELTDMVCARGFSLLESSQVHPSPVNLFAAFRKISSNLITAN